MKLDPVLQKHIKHMPQGDDTTLIILKGHLLLEELLMQIVRTVVAHGNLLEDTRLTFAELASLARSMCWSKHNSDMWDLISSINVLRNDLAHKLESPKFEQKLKHVLEAHISSIEDPEKRSEVEAMSVPDQLKFAVVYTMGFLNSYLSDAQAYRKTVDNLYKTLESLPKD